MEGASSMEIPVSKRRLCKLFPKGEKAIARCVTIISAHLITMIPEETAQIRQLVTGLKSHWRGRMKKCSNKKDRFEVKYKDWLDSYIKVPGHLIRPETEGESKRGRPAMEFHEKGLRAQQKFVANIAKTQTQPTTPLLKATIRTVSKRGLKATSFLIKQAIKSPGRSLKMKKILTAAKFRKSFTPQDALALLLDINLTTNQYIKLRKAIVQKGHKDVLPPYYKVKEAKEKCRPPESKIEISDASASVPLRDLALHTAQRIVELQEEVVIQHQASRNLHKTSATLICSWGFDGSTGQSQYKQKPSENHSSPVMQDSSLFATAMIPLRLISDDHKNPSKCTVLWQNPTPHSPRFCRPIQLEFAKESPELVLTRKQQVENQIQEMTVSGPMCIPVWSMENSLDIKFDFHLTLIDGKILNICTGTKSNQVCPICSNRPLEFNKPENLKYGFKPNAGSLRFGASPLHAWIRFLECCLHISYRLEFKKWRVVEDEHKTLRKNRKKQIKEWIQENMGIIVDQPKAGGSGNTNDGNTARRLFSNYAVFASILGLNEELVHRFSTILIALNCQLELNTEEFGKFCMDTAKLYIEFYDWYPMPATVHKILVHGKDILESCILPVGVFSEEAPESCNKLYRRFRLNYSRKCSRKATMTDLFGRCIDNSDPLLSSQTVASRNSCRRRHILPQEVQSLLGKAEVAGGRELFFEEDTLDWEPEQLLENCDFSLLDDEDIGEYEYFVDDVGIVMYEVDIHLDSLDDVENMDQAMQL